MWPFGKSTKDRLEAAVKDNKVLGNYDIGVDVKKSKAVFTGEVPRDSVKNLLKVVAEGINGIKDVDMSGVNVKQTEAAPQAAAQKTTPQTSQAAPAPTRAAGSPAAPAASQAKQGAQPAQAKTEPEVDPSALAKAALQNIRGESSLANNPLDVLQSSTTIVLRGAVDSQQEFDKAKSLAGSVSGVTRVDTSGLQIIQNASQLNTTDDDGDIVYTIKSGDTLSHIALHYYGDAGKSSYMKIADANGLADANKIQVGQELKIPGTTAGPEAQLS